jgi:hypothetical protein
LIIEHTLTWIYKDCNSKSDKGRFCTETGDRLCHHALTLAACMKVSTQWFYITARHLWGKYAELPQLMSLITSDRENPLYVSICYYLSSDIFD